MRTNEKVWTVGAALMFIGMAAFYSCEESEASVPPPGCCEVPRVPTAAYLDAEGNAVVVGPAAHRITVEPGYVLEEDGRLSAEIGSRCYASLKRAIGRHAAKDRVVIVCLDREYTEPPPEPAREE